MADAVPLFNGLKHLPCPKEAGGETCTTPGCLFGHRTDHQPSNRPSHQSLDGVADQEGSADGDNEGPPSKRQKVAPLRPGEAGGGGGGGGEGDSQGGSEGDSDGRQITNTNHVSKPVDTVQTSDLYDPLSPPVVGDSRVGPPKPVTPSSSGKRTSTPPTRAAKSQSNVSKSATPVKSSASPASATAGKSTPTSLSASPLANSSSDTRFASPLATRQSASNGKAASSSQAPKPQRKSESLNPRHLKSAPATHTVRHKLVGLLHAEFTRLNREVSDRGIKDPELKALVLSAQELIWMALDREQQLATSKPAIYNNAMRQEVMKYKKMQFDAWVLERRQALEKPLVQKNSSIGPPVTINTGLTPDQEVDVLRRLITPVTNLEQFGYVSTAPTDEEIDRAKQAVEWSKGWEQCSRCTARFQVFPGRNIETGELASGGQCTHHPGKQYMPQRAIGNVGWVAKKYRCCNQDVGESPGCTVAKHHVWKTNDPKRLASLWNYAETPANDSSLVKKVVAFDCEMGFTVYGLELVRVTATSWPDGATLLDVLVQPYGEILDLNSRYSGVFPEDLARAVPWTRGWTPPPQQPSERKILPKVSSPEMARDLLFSLISPSTILIGHGLENDLNAMRMVHSQIIDTVLLFPHKRGLPVRTGLKVLMESILNRRIQVDTGEGHDSAEDARAAGDLVRYKVEKEWILMRSQGWELVDGSVRPPGWKPHLQQQTSEESVDAEEGGALLTEEFLEAGS